MSFLDRALRMGEAKKFKTYEQRVGRINAFEPELEHYGDGELREAADALRERAQNGESLDRAFRHRRRCDVSRDVIHSGLPPRFIRAI